MTLHDLAKDCAAIAASKGFAPPSWENLPVKLMLVVTELDETSEASATVGAGHFAEELSDVAIRLLGILGAIWPEDWATGRIEDRSLRLYSLFQDIETLLWPVLRHCCNAVACWRKGKNKDVMQHCELALLETYRLADSLSIDLNKEINLKCEINRKREYLHGDAHGGA